MKSLARLNKKESKTKRHLKGAFFVCIIFYFTIDTSVKVYTRAPNDSNEE